MKNRLKAILLATGLTVSMLYTCAYAEEASTEAVTETVTESAESESDAEAAETESAVEEAEEAVSEAEEAAAEAAAGTYAAYYDSMKESVPQTLQALSVMTDEQLNQIIEESDDASTVAMAATWQSVKNDLGNFVEVTSQEVSEEGYVITVASVASYDGVEGNAPVEVVYTFNAKDGTASLSWNVDYPMSTLMKQAGLNTIMGLCIVFVTLLFLSFLIGKIHWIPDLIEARQKKNAPAAAVPSPAPVQAPAVEEEDYVDDLELVAVITAAIAASEQTSGDGFVVRSIKKANRRKWQNA